MAEFVISAVANSVCGADPKAAAPFADYVLYGLCFFAVSAALGFSDWRYVRSKTFWAAWVVAVGICIRWLAASTKAAECVNSVRKHAKSIENFAQIDRAILFGSAWQKAGAMEPAWVAMFTDYVPLEVFAALSMLMAVVILRKLPDKLNVTLMAFAVVAAAVLAAAYDMTEAKESWLEALSLAAYIAISSIFRGELSILAFLSSFVRQIAAFYVYTEGAKEIDLWFCIMVSFAVIFCLTVLLVRFVSQLRHNFLACLQLHLLLSFAIISIQYATKLHIYSAAVALLSVIMLRSQGSSSAAATYTTRLPSMMVHLLLLLLTTSLVISSFFGGKHTVNAVPDTVDGAYEGLSECVLLPWAAATKAGSSNSGSVFDDTWYVASQAIHPHPVFAVRTASGAYFPETTMTENFARIFTGAYALILFGLQFVFGIILAFLRSALADSTGAVLTTEIPLQVGMPHFYGWSAVALAMLCFLYTAIAVQPRGGSSAMAKSTSFSLTSLVAVGPILFCTALSLFFIAALLSHVFGGYSVDAEINGRFLPKSDAAALLLVVCVNFWAVLALPLHGLPQVFQAMRNFVLSVAAATACLFLTMIPEDKADEAHSLSIGTAWCMQQSSIQLRLADHTKLFVGGTALIVTLLARSLQPDADAADDQKATPLRPTDLRQLTSLAQGQQKQFTGRARAGSGADLSTAARRSQVSQSQVSQIATSTVGLPIGGKPRTSATPPSFVYSAMLGGHNETPVEQVERNRVGSAPVSVGAPSQHNGDMQYGAELKSPPARLKVTAQPSATPLWQVWGGAMPTPSTGTSIRTSYQPPRGEQTDAPSWRGPTSHLFDSSQSLPAGSSSTSLNAGASHSYDGLLDASRRMAALTPQQAAMAPSEFGRRQFPLGDLTTDAEQDQFYRAASQPLQRHVGLNATNARPASLDADVAGSSLAMPRETRYEDTYDNEELQANTLDWLQSDHNDIPNERTMQLQSTATTLSRPGQVASLAGSLGNGLPADVTRQQQHFKALSGIKRTRPELQSTAAEDSYAPAAVTVRAPHPDDDDAEFFDVYDDPFLAHFEAQIAKRYRG